MSRPKRDAEKEQARKLRATLQKGHYLCEEGEAGDLMNA